MVKTRHRFVPRLFTGVLECPDRGRRLVGYSLAGLGSVASSQATLSFELY